MQKRTKRILWVAIVLLVGGAIGWFIFGGKSPGEVEQYKAELRAKGEKLTYADLGFPKPPEDGASLLRLTNAVSRIRRKNGEAGKFTPSSYTGNRPQRVVWRDEGMPVDTSTNLMSWEEYGALLRNLTNELADIRAAVEVPTRWFQHHPAGYFTNFVGTRYPFVEMRNAAQWLYADGIEALHGGDLSRARQDHRALIQLAELNREDPTLVAAMIRVAIAGLGLELTWQAWQHPDWTNADLAAMQHDWERVDLLAAVETGCLGERAATEMIFDVGRQRGTAWMRRTMAAGVPTPVWEKMRDTFEGMMWDADADELLALRHHQVTMESIRALRAGKTWAEADAALKQQQKVFDEAMSSKGLDHYRYQISALAIPNTSKAIQTSVRNEALRRLAITAIALKRFQIRQQRYPEKLQELVPDFLASVPIDPMDAKPLRYRREGDTDFVLYSVGENGRDDGGVGAAAGQSQSWWTGQDVVWGTAVKE
jgi:hypothetical protein